MVNLNESEHHHHHHHPQQHQEEEMTKPFKSQLSLPTKDRSRRSFKRAIQARSNSQLEPIESEAALIGSGGGGGGGGGGGMVHLDDLDLDFNIQLKNVGEVAAMALLKHRIQRGSITSADVPLAFRRNATVLRDIKNIAMYHQHMKKSVDQKSTSGLYHTSADSRSSTTGGYRSNAWSNSQQSITAKLVRKFFSI